MWEATVLPAAAAFTPGFGPIWGYYTNDRSISVHYVYVNTISLRVGVIHEKEIE